MVRIENPLTNLNLKLILAYFSSELAQTRSVLNIVTGTQPENLERNATITYYETVPTVLL